MHGAFALYVIYKHVTAYIHVLRLCIILTTHFILCSIYTYVAALLPIFTFKPFHYIIYTHSGLYVIYTMYSIWTAVILNSTYAYFLKYVYVSYPWQPLTLYIIYTPLTTDSNHASVESRIRTVRSELHCLVTGHWDTMRYLEDTAYDRI